MTDLEQRLAATLTDMGEEAPHDPDLLGTVRPATGRRLPGPRTTVALGAAAALGTAAAVAVVAAVVGGGSPSGDGEVATDPAPAAYSCVAEVAPRLVPAWARAGFSDPEPRMPYVGGDAGIVGILFAQPLTAPVSADHNNKVLWVAQQDSGALRIEARLDPSDAPAVIESVTGPSYLDLPAPGCWHLDLSWGEGAHTAAVDLQVSSP